MVGQQAGEVPVEGEAQLNHLYSIIAYGGEEPTNHKELLSSTPPPKQNGWRLTRRSSIRTWSTNLGRWHHGNWRLQRAQKSTNAKSCARTSCILSRRHARRTEEPFSHRCLHQVAGAGHQLRREVRRNGAIPVQPILGIVAQAAHFNMDITVIDIKMFFLYGKLLTGDNDKLFM